MNQNKESKKESSKNGSFIDELLDYAKVLCCTVAVILLVFTFIARDAWVNGSSMQPTLLNGDLLILRTFVYEPEQGDIIACNAYALGKVIVKRIAAVGGQTVTIDFNEGKVYVNGEEFLVDRIQNITTLREGRDIVEMKVPEGKYFVLGDNRQDSTDSRSAVVGFIDREDILGKAIIRLYPFNNFTVF